MRVLYIAGLGRSGSTLLSRLLGQVDGICALGEAHHIWRTGAPRAAADELCGCGRSYAQCGFTLTPPATAFLNFAQTTGMGVQLTGPNSFVIESGPVKVPTLLSGMSNWRKLWKRWLPLNVPSCGVIR